jgi:hypothetical protein
MTDRTTHLARVREIGQRWLATMGMDDETLELRKRVEDLRSRLPGRPPWWRPFSRRQWDAMYDAVTRWAYERYNWPTEPYK